MDAHPQRLSFDQAVDLVADVAKRAEKVAAGLRELREPEAAAMVECLAQDAGRAAAALSALLEPVRKGTDWYEVHRNMWIRYGDPGDLTAMTENIASHPELP